MRSSTIPPLAVLAFLGLCSCGSCDEPRDDPKVPFKLGHKAVSAAHDGGAQANTTVSTGEALATSYAPPMDQPELEGARIPLSIVRASLLVDLDADGDRDAMLLADDSDKKLTLSVALRDDRAFAEARVMPSFSVPFEPSCSIEHVRIQALSADKGLAVVSSSCSETGGAGPTQFALFSLEAAPRVYHRVSLPGATPDAPAAQLACESADADADGHDDVLLALTLPGSDGTPTDPLKFALLDRPSGLVRDAREPDTTLSAWASAALGLVPRAPDQAIFRAEQVLSMYRALCREGGAPVLSIDGAPGFSCGNLSSPQTAALALVLGHGKRGQVAEAFAAYAAFTQGKKKPDAKSLTRARDALRALPAEKGVTLREGPKLERVRTAHVHLPLARFVDENTLFVRRSQPVLVALDSFAETPAPAEADDLVRDPSGQLAVTDIERTCTGHALRIERRAQPASDFVSAPAVSTPLLARFASAPGCTTLPEAERRDRAGFRVLGWAPQGVIAARGAALFVVPLDLEGKPTGEPRALDRATPVPAPLPLGAALPDGTKHVEATPFGVLVYGQSGVTLLRPDGYDSAVTEPSDAALSPSGQRIAVVSGERVFLLTRSSSSTP